MTRERRVALAGNKYGTRPIITALTAALPDAHHAPRHGGPAARPSTLCVFLDRASPWMTKTIARCSRRTSVRAAPAGVSTATTPRTAAVRGLTNVAVALTVEQAACIRALTGVTSHLVLDIALFGEPVKLHLVGRKVDTTNWAGTASAYSDAESVAGDLAHGPRSPSRSCPK